MIEPSVSRSLSPAGKPLAELLASIPLSEVRGRAGIRVRELAYRSTEVREGWLFFCVPGSRVDGHDYARDAVAFGASAAVVERWLDLPLTQVRVPSVRAAMGPMSAAFYGNPADGLTVVGVTGTNGKTTTTYLLESIFRSSGLRPAIVGTTGVRVDGKRIPFDRTTPEAPDLQRLFARMAEEGVEGVAMEVSSHGLHQHRVDGTRFGCAVFTNLSQDHLDYHRTMDQYLEAKRRLFTAALSERGVVNADSPEGRRVAGRADIPIVTFGVQAAADVRATDVSVSASGVSFAVGGLEVRSRLRGRFNVYNCLAALTAGRQVGIPDERIAEGISALAGVPGRLEPVEAGQPFLVLVDYAHTPDSLENVLAAARGLTAGRVIAVFGCGGDRDRGKRPLMGETATRLADLAVVTSDNPRSEDPEGILAQIEAGARRGGNAFVIEPDRRAAIRIALENADEDDVVVIAGKGHETGQEFADRVIPFDDRVVAAEELTKLRKDEA